VIKRLVCKHVQGSVLALSLVVSIAQADPTDLDTSFGAGGIARLDRNVQLKDMAANAEGSLYVLESLGEQSTVIKLDRDGRRDQSYSFVNPAQARVDSVATTRSGQLYALRVRTVGAGELEVTISRHLDDGGLDAAYGTSGIAFVDRFRVGSLGLSEFGTWYRDLAVDSSGRAYLVAESAYGGQYARWIARVDATGASSERLFERVKNPGDDSVVLHYFGRPRVQHDGKIVVPLQSYTRASFGGAPAHGAALLRLHGGVPDAEFGIGGVAFAPVPGWQNLGAPPRALHNLDRTSDGGYVGAGVTALSLLADPFKTPMQVVVVKFAADGRVDTSFATNGIARLDLVSGRVEDPQVAVQPDGRLVVAATLEGATAGHVFERIGIARLTSTGQPDVRFAGGGSSSIWADAGARVRFLSVRPDGRLVFAGDVATAILPGGLVTTEVAVFQLNGGDLAIPRPLGERLAVEYFHSGYGHYFLTADAEEIAHLDVVSPGGWARTGQTFRVWDGGDASLVPVCRFWSDQSFAPRSSHFYTPYTAECAGVKANPAWTFERDAFYVRLPQGAAGFGACGHGSKPLYRAYNNGMGGAPNHRYTADAATLDAMIASGWLMEGEANTRVFACVPS
jgi:uncharacterized delta-60 repeat protein